MPPGWLQGSTAITAELSDDDRNVSNKVWKWQRASSHASDWSDISTGSSYTVVSSDRGNRLRAIVSYSDIHSSSQSATSAAIPVPEATTPPPIIQPPDPDNDQPTFPSDEDGTRRIPENTPNAENIGDPVEADDDDTVLTYSLGGTDAASFGLDTGTGQLKTSADLNYETKNTYVVEVSVSDGKDDNGHSDTVTDDDTITVTINVTNVNEPGSVSLGRGTLTIVGDVFVNTTIDATVLDPDLGIENERWQWERWVESSSQWDPITDAAGPSYTPGDDMVGNRVRATVSYTDTLAQGNRAVSRELRLLQHLPYVWISRHENTDETVKEGSEIRFVVHATDSQSSDLMVNIEVTQDGDFLTGTIPTEIAVPVTDKYAHVILQTDPDTVDEADGSVTVTLEEGSGYDVFYLNNSLTVNVKDDDSIAPPTALHGNGNIVNGEVVTWWRGSTGAAAYDLRYAVENCPDAGTPMNAAVTCTPGAWTTVEGITSTNKKLSAGTGSNDQLDSSSSIATDTPVYPVYRLQVRATNAYGHSPWSVPAFIAPTSDPPVPAATAASLGKQRLPEVATAPLYGYQQGHQFRYFICNGTIPSDAGINTNRIAAVLERWETAAKKSRISNMVTVTKVTAVPEDACQRPDHVWDMLDTNEVQFTDKKGMDRLACPYDQACWRTVTLVLDTIDRSGGVLTDLHMIFGGRVMLRETRTDGVSWNDVTRTHNSDCTMAEHTIMHESATLWASADRTHRPTLSTPRTQNFPL